MLHLALALLAGLMAAASPATPGGPKVGTALGGRVGIHGGGARSDWTWGCIAVSDGEAEFLFTTLRVGDRVIVDP